MRMHKNGSRLRRLRVDDDAAAGVVAILLSILVVILLLTLVTSVWMPVWMEEREADQTRGVASDFGNLKATIDNQILQGDTTLRIASPIDLGTEGIAMFGSDSSGSISINHFREDELEFYCNVINETGEVNVTCTGGFAYESSNNYYVNQKLAYENGAIILDQGDTEVMRIGPQFAVEKNGPVNTISFVLITIAGVESSLQGTGTVLFESQLVTYTSAGYTFLPAGWLNFTMVTEYTTAWSAYFGNTLIEAGLAPGTDYNLTVSENTVTLDIKNVQLFELGYALIKAEIEM